MAAIYPGIESAVLLVPVVLFAFWIWMLVDCVRNKTLGPTERWIWMLVIFLFPAAALFYSMLKRQKRSGPFAGVTEKVGL